MISLYKKKLDIIHDTLFWETEYVKRHIYISIGEEAFDDLFSFMNAMEMFLNENQIKNFVRKTINALFEQFNRFGRLSDENRSLLNTYITLISQCTENCNLVDFDGYKKFQDLFISSSLKDISYLKDRFFFDNCFKLLFFSIKYGYYPDTFLMFYDQISIIKTLNNAGQLPSPPIVLPTIFNNLNSHIFNEFILHECGIILQKPKARSSIEKKHIKNILEKQITERLRRYKNNDYRFLFFKYLSIINKILINGDYDSLKITEKEELLDLYMKIKNIGNRDVHSMSRAQGLFLWDNDNITNEYKSRVDAIKTLEALLIKMKIKNHSERYYTDKYECTKQCIELGQVLPISGANKIKIAQYKLRMKWFKIVNIDYDTYAL